MELHDYISWLIWHVVFCYVCFYILKIFLKQLLFLIFFIKLIFFMFSGDFDAFMLKIIFKKLKKYYFNVFLSKKYFKK
jgi:hypothetical protein